MATKNKPEVIGYDENGPCYALTRREKFWVYGTMVAGCAALGLAGYFLWGWVWG